MTRKFKNCEFEDVFMLGAKSYWQCCVDGAIKFL